MQKLKKIMSVSLMIVCAFFVSLTFAGCRKKIDNADIQVVLPGVTGTYTEFKYPFTELEPEGFVKAYIVNGNTYVVKSRDVWTYDGTKIEIITAIRNGNYLNIVAKKTEESTITDEKLKTVQSELNYYKNKNVTFALNDSTKGAVSGYNYPKTLNTHYNVVEFIKANPKINALFPQVNFESGELDFETNNPPAYGKPLKVNYKSTILSCVEENNNKYIVVKTFPQNIGNTSYSPYCSVTLYVTLNSDNVMEDYSVLELYCSPNATSHRTPEQIEKILGLTDFENNKNNINVAQGTLTSGAVWYSLKAAKSYAKG